jgi:hypothetical protein
VTTLLLGAQLVVPFVNGMQAQGVIATVGLYNLKSVDI